MSSAGQPRDVTLPLACEPGQNRVMRMRRAVGSYGPFDLMRNPVRLISVGWLKGPPGPEAGQADIAAVRAGGARKVTCFLRGFADPYPHRLTQGTLYISAGETYWVPLWSLRRPKLQIHLAASDVQTRPADHREPRGVPKGGRGMYLVKLPVCMVVTTDLGDGAGTVDFVVPSADAPLVAGYLSGSLTQ
jgi:hypothetical protein